MRRPASTAKAGFDAIGSRRIAGRRRCGFGCQRRTSRCGSCANYERISQCPNPFDLRWVTNLVVGRWWLRLEWFIPPPVGALAGRSGAGRYDRRGFSRRARQRSCAKWSASAVGHGQVICGPGDGDDAPMVQPVVIGAEEHQVRQLGCAAVFPMQDVVCMQTAGRSTTRNRARSVAVLERTAQPAVDQAGRPPGADDQTVTFEPHFARGHRSGIGVQTR